jgi:hypothetical protein
MNEAWSLPPVLGTPGTLSSMCRVISEGMRDSHPAKFPDAFTRPIEPAREIRPVPLSWLNAACSPSTTSG